MGPFATLAEILKVGYPDPVFRAGPDPGPDPGEEAEPFKARKVLRLRATLVAEYGVYAEAA